VVFEIFSSQHREIALKLKDHRLKPGGVTDSFSYAGALGLWLAG
jgi:hypothetical protein